MNARPEVRDALVRKKMVRWREIARFPNAYKGTCPSKARKNFWRLMSRHPQVAASLEFTAASVYL